MDELEAGVEFTLAVFPEATALLKPGERAFHDPTFGHDGKGVEVTAFGDLHRCPKDVSDSLGKRFTGITAISQHTANPVEIGTATREGFQGSFAVSDFSSGHGDGVRQALGVDGDVALDARYFLAGIVALFLGAIGVLDALRVHDQECRAWIAPLSGAGRANLIF
jgi:hypothetical protein